jgi:hypothetical protein
MLVKIRIGYKAFSRYYFLWKNESHKLYLRNILIKNYNYDKQILLNTIDLLGFSLNFFNSDILPDISRNDLIPDSKTIVDNSINIAIHLSALENFNLKQDEKNIILKFIKRKLVDSSHFIRQDILDKYSL